LARSGKLDEAIKYSYKLIGYDPKKDTFDMKKATAPHSPEVYAILAGIIRSKENNPELAERIVNKMIEANRTSADAFISRGRLLALWGNASGARADVQEAYKLKPE